MVFTIMADAELLILDDRSSGGYEATAGNSWRAVTDGVMGGVSQGRLRPDTVAGRPCLRLEGDVSLENNGGFIQAALNLPQDVAQRVKGYTGLMLELYGNAEQYNVHLRSSDTELPWQSYRATVTVAQAWHSFYLPFAQFQPHRIDKPLDLSTLKRIGLVAIGRPFHADLCMAGLALYR